MKKLKPKFIYILNGGLQIIIPENAYDVRVRFKRFITWRDNFSSHIEMYKEGSEIKVISISDAS